MHEHSVLVIGCGSIGMRHVRCFQLTGRASVTACDSSAEQRDRLAHELGVETSDNWKEAVASGRHSAAIVCTPAPSHVPITVGLLEAGLHVLVEKPLSHSLEHVETLLEQSRQSTCSTSVAYVYHTFPFLVAARKYLQCGALGAIRHATITSGQHFPTGRPADAVHYAQTYYRNRKTGGGAIQDALTHPANWIESILGPTTSVMCDCAHQVLADVTVEDTVNLSARHGDILVNYTLNQFQAPNETTIQFNSATASLKIEFHRQRWGTFNLGDQAWLWRKASARDRDANFVEQANAFLDLVEGKRAPLCSLQQAADTLRFNLAALASAESGARVSTRDIHA